MDDYYGYRARTVLDRPIALTGFLGVPVGRVTNLVVGLTGVPLLDVERAVEHRAGKTISLLVLEDGEAALRQLEGEILGKALSDVPPPVIALSHGALLDATIRHDVARGAHLVWLREDLDVLVERLARTVASKPATQFAWLGGEPPTPRHLEVLFHARRPGYETAELVIDMAGRGPRAVAHEVIERLGLGDSVA